MKKRTRLEIVLFSIIVCVVLIGVAAFVTAYIDINKLEPFSLTGVYCYESSENGIVAEFDGDVLVIYDLSNLASYRSEYEIEGYFYATNKSGDFVDTDGTTYTFVGADDAGTFSATCIERFRVEQGGKTDLVSKLDGAAMYSQRFVFQTYGNVLILNSRDTSSNAVQLKKTDDFSDWCSKKMEYLKYWYMLQRQKDGT